MGDETVNTGNCEYFHDYEERIIVAAKFPRFISDFKAKPSDDTGERRALICRSCGLKKEDER